MVDVQLARRIAEEIHSFVYAEDAMTEFRQAADELVANARRLASGDLSIGRLEHPATADMPDRKCAERIVYLAGLMPGPDGTEERELRRAIGQLHGNVVEAVMHAVFAQYSDVVREAMSRGNDEPVVSS